MTDQEMILKIARHMWPDLTWQWHESLACGSAWCERHDTAFNPLGVSAHALDVAVTMGITVMQTPGALKVKDGAYAVAFVFEDNGRASRQVEAHEHYVHRSGPLEATRRAIVRCAAAMLE